jgi:hypothetical protein
MESMPKFKKGDVVRMYRVGYRKRILASPSEGVIKKALRIGWQVEIIGRDGKPTIRNMGEAQLELVRPSCAQSA